MKFRGPERHLWCVICGDPFTTRHATKLTCSCVCSTENQRRLKAAMVARHTAARRQASAEARLAKPEYRSALERHQTHLRRIWTEHGFPVEELEALPFYSIGFDAPQAVKVTNR